MQELVLTVRDIHCESCEQRIARAVGALDGVATVSADHRAARVRAVFDPARTSESAIREIVARAGYEVAP